MANIEGLRKTLEYIKEHPGQWDQQRWSTCFAGLALRVVAGAEYPENGCCGLCRDVVLDGRVVGRYEIRDLAQETLDLTKEQADKLFFGMNDIAYVTSLVAEFTAEAPVSA